VVFFKEDGVLVLGFAKQLPLGEGVLKMDFNGTLNDQMRGFYRRYARILSGIYRCWCLQRTS
jgi:puromycin-sensitive aminopeptidase